MFEILIHELDTRLHNFAEDFVSAYQTAPSPPGFIGVRKKVASLLEFSVGTTESRLAKAYAAEFFTLVCLDPLDRYGLKPWLAPYSLESGDESRKGVDIVVSSENEPLIAFNVKLAPLKQTQIAPRHLYDPQLQSPVTHVYFGNWRFRPKELKDHMPDANFDYWLKYLAFPHICHSGKLPYIRDLRSHLLEQVIFAVQHYQAKIGLYRAGEYDPGEREVRVFPHTNSELNTLMNKLTFANEIFTLLSRDLLEQ